jgi:tripartite-type tricarboxylate transporter receptor subunit TctC
VLATTGEETLVRIPGRADLKDLGYPVEYYAWNGFVAPPERRKVVVERINKSANLALCRADVIKALRPTDSKSSAARLMCLQGDERVYPRHPRDRPEEQSEIE